MRLLGISFLMQKGIPNRVIEIFSFDSFQDNKNMYILKYSVIDGFHLLLFVDFSGNLFLLMCNFFFEAIMCNLIHVAGREFQQQRRRRGCVIWKNRLVACVYFCQ